MFYYFFTLQVDSDEYVVPLRAPVAAIAFDFGVSS